MFKPMLAGTMKDTKKLRFPLLASQKLDGLRATVQDGRLYSRSLKPLPNKYVQEQFARIPQGLDGELIVGNPLAPDAFRKTTSLVMSDDKPLDWFNNQAPLQERDKDYKLRLYVFDKFGPKGFSDRMLEAATETSRYSDVGLIWVYQTQINTLEELDAYEAYILAKGAEGVMLRSYDGLYKQGRSTELEGWLLKVKRFVDAEAIVLDSFEEMRNENEQETNELGRSKRSSAKEGKVPKGTLGGLTVRDLTTQVEFNVGGGFTAAEREAYWKDRANLNGRIVKYKSFPSGGKDKPRHPVFLGFRDVRDM